MPAVVVVVDAGRADDDDVDVTGGVGVAPGERSEHDDADRSGRDVGGGAAEFVEDAAAGLGDGEDGPGSYVLFDESEQGGRGDVALFHDPLVDQVGHDP